MSNDQDQEKKIDLTPYLAELRHCIKTIGLYLGTEPEDTAAFFEKAMTESDLPHLSAVTLLKLRDEPSAKKRQQYIAFILSHDMYEFALMLAGIDKVVGGILENK